MTTATPDAMRRFRPDWTSTLIPQRDDDAVIKLNVSQINQGGPARFDSFRLAMP
jgi:hypothetical protein